MPVGPAVLSLQTGAPLITAFVSYTPTKLRIEFTPPIAHPEKGSQQENVLAMIQETANRFAFGIAGKTEDWHMLQRVFIDREFRDREAIQA